MSQPGHEPRGDDEHAAALDELLEVVTRLHDGDRQDLVRRFAEVALRRVPAVQLRAADPEQTAKQLLDAFRVADTRSPGELAIRVFTPDVALDGWSDPGTVIEVICDDRPFLLTTVTEELRVRGHEIVRSLHPIFGVERGDDGRLRALQPARTAEQRESFIHIELDAELDDGAATELREALGRVVNDALAASRDYDAMCEHLREAARVTRETATARFDADEVHEAADLLTWLLDDNFVLLGWREYDVRVHQDGVRRVSVRPDTGLGVLAGRPSRFDEPVAWEELDPDVRGRYLQGRLLTITRTNALSTVQRRTRMDYIGVTKVTSDGEVAGEYRLFGLFTRKGYAEPAEDTPVVRRKLATILEREDVVPGSHDEIQLTSLFQALPKDELFQSDIDTLHRNLVTLVAAEEQRETRIMVRVDEFSRNVTVLLAVPRDRYSPALRERLQQVFLERFGGERVDVAVSLGDRNETLARFAIHSSSPTVPAVDLQDLQREVRAMARSWSDDIGLELVRRFGESEGRRLTRQYADRMPTAYRDGVAVDEAIEDVLELEALTTSTANLRVAVRAGSVLARVKAYRRGEPLVLSRFVPILESLGLEVVEEKPYHLRGEGEQLNVHDFGVRDPRGGALDIDAFGPRIAAAALAARDGLLEVDGLNQLVLVAGLDWPEVAILRAYRRYRRQVGTNYTTQTINVALVDHPEVTAAIVDLFHARFNPEVEADDDAVARARRAALEACDGVERLDQDRILRGFVALVDATLRTNAFNVRDGRPLAFKFDSSAVPDIPKPVPYREIFVYSPEVEGIHLRGGPVARGGLRWSDRYDDVRTEILGLMKAQMLKNAVIVPTGAKGGFVVKKPPADRGELRAEVERQYRAYIGALLDITDNVVDGRVVPPRGLRRHDSDDPYLVVAADKGTATFSDTANSIAMERGFWLGDAFASGGSNGYDHKALGITARGAWVAVRRHFDELGIDVQTDPVTVVGIGDMSGDVFGNGMLQSRSLRLVAAFDHRDIFIDPDPDPETSYAERERLFSTPGTSWQDYDRQAITEGGGVYSRDLKRIELTPQVREALRVEATEATPAELIQAILSAPVDLLFAGGIGTFVKATHETHADIGDRANDETRIDASQVRARVVGEGANLSFTQAARIQYARRGGRINMDAIDNAAGVDISDHEVNIKILLGLAESTGRLSREDRDETLRDITEDVVEHVLRDVDQQSAMLSRELELSPHAMDVYEALMLSLEARELLDREVERLPGPEEMAERREAGAGLTRPELAVLTGYAKRVVTSAIAGSALPDLELLQPTLLGYFPAGLTERFADLLPDHRLRRELVATIVANDIVNRMGITFSFRLANEAGVSLDRVAGAYWAAREVSNAGELWDIAEAARAVLPSERYTALVRSINQLVRGYTRAYLDDPDVHTIERIVERDRPTFESLQERMLDLGTPRQQARRRERTRDLIDDLIEPADARRLASLAELAMVPDVSTARRAVIGERHPTVIADAFLRIGDALALERLFGHLEHVDATDRWQRWQFTGLVREIQDARSHAVVRALVEEPDLAEPEALSRFLDRRADRLDHVRQLLDALDLEPQPRLDAVSVVVRALREALVHD